MNLRKLRIKRYLTNPTYLFHRLYYDFWVIPKERINRLLSYLPYLWNVGEFHETWHLRLWAHSLRRLYNIMDGGVHVFTQKKKRRMLTAIKCLERMADDWDAYVDSHYEYIEKTYGEIPHSLFGNDKFSSSTQKKLYYEFVVHREDKMYKQDFDLFSKIVKKDLRGWWE